MGKTFIALAALAAATAATPASAAIVINYGGNTAQGQTTQFNVAQSGSPVTATTNQTNTQVIFTRTGGLSTNSAGQASVTNQNQGYLTGTTTVDLEGNTTASYIEFNLPGIPGNPPPSESNQVYIEALSVAGAVLAFGTFDLSGSFSNDTPPVFNGNGQNYFSISGQNPGEVFGGFRVTLLPTNTGVSALQNIRVQTAVAAAVPEPGTWALMLLGFGGVGVTLRRRRPRTLPQFA